MHKPYALIALCAMCASSLWLSGCDKKPPLPPAPLVSAA